MTDIVDNIQEIAQQPAAAAGDGQSVTQRPIADLIAADKYARGNDVHRDATMGLRFGRIIPPGAS